MRKRRKIDPRVERTRSRVLSAAHRLLQTGGPTAVTYSALTRESGVGRATIYRHWSTLDTLWPDLVGEVGRAAAIEPTGDLRADLTSALRVMARNLDSRERRIEVITMLQRVQLEAEARRFVRAIERHNPVRQSLEHARHAGTLREDVDLDVAAALLSGPILQRALMAGAKADARFIDAVVNAFLCSQTTADASPSS